MPTVTPQIMPTVTIQKSMEDKGFSPTDVSDEGEDASSCSSQPGSDFSNEEDAAKHSIVPNETKVEFDWEAMAEHRPNAGACFSVLPSVVEFDWEAMAEHRPNAGAIFSATPLAPLDVGEAWAQCHVLVRSRLAAKGIVGHDTEGKRCGPY